MTPTMTWVRWRICGVMFLGAVLGFVDRSSLAVAMPYIRTELHLSAVQAGYAFTVFLMTYAPALLISGQIADRYGARGLAAAAATFWSFCVGLVAMVGNFPVLIGLRLLLGVAESGATPSWAKGVSLWFPKRERGLAVSIYDNGNRVGNFLALPIMAGLIGLFGWRMAFVATALLGLAWVPLWLWIYRVPRQHPKANAAEIAYIEQGGAMHPDAAPEPVVPWIDLLRHRTTWGLIFICVCLAGQAYFYIFWIPTYLVEVRHFALLKVGLVGMLPAVGAACGGLTGGIANDIFVRRGRSVNFARKSCLAAGLAGASAVALAAGVDSVVAVVALMVLGYFCNAVASVTSFMIPLDLAPVAGRTSSLAAIQTSSTMVGAMVFPLFVGYLLSWTGGSFIWPFIATGALSIGGILALLLLVGTIGPLPILSHPVASADPSGAAAE